MNCILAAYSASACLLHVHVAATCKAVMIACACNSRIKNDVVLLYNGKIRVVIDIELQVLLCRMWHFNYWHPP